ncbi:very-short-patch-repair endonuclease [Mycolicibacterium fluoranthenivorans]|uniref:Very-short-patch-repair endonuclease n=1 Tax=Mycolicibacterium fluoranthenivorans TaxID=258505 RepID=A0A7X5TYE5_9MYCO|nr:very-short-patch-repair endonuclease [Mycolicibacterium fluoranthenivorans]
MTTNRARDERVNSVLNEAGWIVLRFWEHEDPTEVAAQIVETVRFRPQWRRP